MIFREALGEMSGANTFTDVPENVNRAVKISRGIYIYIVLAVGPEPMPTICNCLALSDPSFAQWHYREDSANLLARVTEPSCLILAPINEGNSGICGDP
jgi:hypothetical protein